MSDPVEREHGGRRARVGRLLATGGVMLVAVAVVGQVAIHNAAAAASPQTGQLIVLDLKSPAGSGSGQTGGPVTPVLAPGDSVIEQMFLVNTGGQSLDRVALSTTVTGDLGPGLQLVGWASSGPWVDDKAEPPAGEQLVVPAGALERTGVVLTPHLDPGQSLFLRLKISLAPDDPAASHANVFFSFTTLP